MARVKMIIRYQTLQTVFEKSTAAAIAAIQQHRTIQLPSSLALPPKWPSPHK